MSSAEKDRIVRMVETLIAEVTRMTAVPVSEVVLESTRLFVHPDYRQYVEGQ